MKVLTIVAVCLLSVALGPSLANGKLSMQVFMGSLCPDAIRFVQNQLYPLYPDIKDHVDLVFVPFGKANSSRNVNGSWTFTCQHGAADCSVSRIQMCAMSFIKDDPDATMDFIGCQMASGSDRTGRTCANHVNLPYNNVTGCVDNALGDALMLQAERMTIGIQDPLDWVPTITFNWVFNQDLTWRSEWNLKEVVCEQLQYNAPVCHRREHNNYPKMN